MTVNLPEETWQRVLAILATGPWQAVNPIIMELGRQLQAQSVPAGAPRQGTNADLEAAVAGVRPNGADPNP